MSLLAWLCTPQVSRSGDTHPVFEAAVRTLASASVGTPADLRVEAPLAGVQPLLLLAFPSNFVAWLAGPGAARCGIRLRCGTGGGARRLDERWGHTESTEQRAHRIHYRQT